MVVAQKDMQYLYYLEVKSVRVHLQGRSSPEVIKEIHAPQLNMKVFLLIIVKMPIFQQLLAI